MIITTKMVEEHPILKRVLQRYPSVFKENTDSEYNVLILFLMYERCKGEKSFWNDYFNLQPHVGTPVEWEDEIQNFIEDPKLLGEINQCKSVYKHDWEVFKRIIDFFSDIFPTSTETDYLWASQFITTRCFGWNLPCTMLVPMVDCQNHSYDDLCSTEIINLRYEREKDKRFLEEIEYRPQKKIYDNLFYLRPLTGNVF